MILLAAQDVNILIQMGDQVAHIWPLFLLAGGFLGLLRTLIKRARIEITEIVEQTIAPIHKEVQENGGGSIKDAVKRVEVMGNNIVVKVDELSVGLDRALKIATANQSRVSAVLANFEAAYYEMDAEGTILYVNDAFLRLYDITEREALAGEIWRTYISREDLDMMDRTGEHALKTHMDWYATFTVKRDGVEIPVTARAKPMFAGDEFIGYSGAMTYDADLIPRQ